MQHGEINKTQQDATDPAKEEISIVSFLPKTSCTMRKSFVTLNHY